MIRRIALAIGIGIALLGPWLVPPAAIAHPLGNFTINVAIDVRARPDALRIGYLVDMAEIPALQARSAIDAGRGTDPDATESRAWADARCARLDEGLAVTVDGAPLAIRPIAATVTYPSGIAGLPTLRLSCSLVADAPLGGATAHRLAIDDRNYAGRIGWHEIVLATDGLRIETTDAETTSPSAGLTSYPADLLSSPMDQRSASATLSIGASSSIDAAPDLVRGGPSFSDRLTERLAALVTRPDASVGFVLAALAVAFGIGAIHALGPGHGKTLMAAYLVGGTARVRDVVAIGVAVSAMHTASVVGLGVAVAVVGSAFAPEVAYRWIGLVSAVAVATLGGSLLVRRARALRHHHPHRHEHVHEHPPALEPEATSWRRLGVLAASGGALPSPSALIVLLSSAALGRLGFGLVLIAMFSIGLAAALTVVGLTAARAGTVLRARAPEALTRFVPAASAAALTAVGIALTTRAVMSG